LRLLFLLVFCQVHFTCLFFMQERLFLFSKKTENATATNSFCTFSRRRSYGSRKKSDTNYTIILSILSAKCNLFCKRFIRGIYIYYNKNFRFCLIFQALPDNARVRASYQLSHPGSLLLRISSTLSLLFCHPPGNDRLYLMTTKTPPSILVPGG